MGGELEAHILADMKGEFPFMAWKVIAGCREQREREKERERESIKERNRDRLRERERGV